MGNRKKAYMVRFNQGSVTPRQLDADTSIDSEDSSDRRLDVFSDDDYTTEAESNPEAWYQYKLNKLNSKKAFMSEAKYQYKLDKLNRKKAYMVRFNQGVVTPRQLDADT